jgi:hypothetical protein
MALLTAGGGGVHRSPHRLAMGHRIGLAANLTFRRH